MALAAVPSPRQRLQALNPAQRQRFRTYIAGATQPAPAPVATGSPTTFVLPGSAEAEFGAQQGNIGETYTEETASNQYQLRNAQIARQREIRDQTDQFTQARTSFPEQYIARGIMGKGGIYGGDLNRLNQMRERQVNDSTQDYTRQLAGLRLSREGIERRRALALANLRMKHQSVLSDAAARSIK